jgi:hypothetical protein
MNVGALIFMLLSWSGVIALSVFCFSRMFRRSGNEPPPNE